MPRLFARQLLQPDPPSLYDFLQAAVWLRSMGPLFAFGWLVTRQVHPGPAGEATHSLRPRR